MLVMVVEWKGAREAAADLILFIWGLGRDWQVQMLAGDEEGSVVQWCRTWKANAKTRIGGTGQGWAGEWLVSLVRLGGCRPGTVPDEVVVLPVTGPSLRRRAAQQTRNRAEQPARRR